MLLLFICHDIKVESASYRRIDKEVFVFLPTNSRGFITSKFNVDELKEVFEGEHCLWIEILNRSFEDTIINKNKLLGFLLIEPENLKNPTCTAKKKDKTKKKARCSI